MRLLKLIICAQANFCNASGMFAYVSGQTGCFYQQAICDPSGWRNSVAFLGLVGDMTFTLMIDGISPKAVPVPGSSLGRTLHLAA